MSINLLPVRRLTTKQKTATASAACAGALALTFAVTPGGAEENQTGLSSRMAAEGVDLPGNAISAPGDPRGTLSNATEDSGGAASGDTAPGPAIAGPNADDSPAQQRAAELYAVLEGSTGEVSGAEDDAAQSDSGGQTDQVSTSQTNYSDDLDGWIREALDVMEENDIPGSYEGLHRNTIRESSGDPFAINEWDINAQNGVPSKGLLQVIQPTFDAYHVDGTEYDLYDPVANLTAAANYAADRYGSIDNVDGPY